MQTEYTDLLYIHIHKETVAYFFLVISSYSDCIHHWGKLSFLKTYWCFNTLTLFRIYCAKPHNIIWNNLYIFLWHNNPNWTQSASFLRFPDQRQLVTETLRTTDQLTTDTTTYTIHNKCKTQTSMPSPEFEPMIPATRWL